MLSINTVDVLSLVKFEIWIKVVFQNIVTAPVPVIY
jgi:hypothetical protein